MRSLTQFPRAVKHTGFWLALYAINLLFWGTSLKELEFAMIVNLFFCVFRLPLSYFNIYYLIPRFLQERKFLHYLIWLFILLALHSIFFRFAVAYFWEPNLKPVSETDRDMALSVFSQMKQFLIELYIQAMVVAVKLGQNWLRANKKTAALEKKQVEMELSMLKNQLQPHFFFNTLNSLYALCLAQPKKAAESILGLSEVLDYILYRSGKTYILLQHELDVVEKYIALECLRFDKPLKIIWQIEDGVAKSIIPPLSLLTLIENSFKHGLHEINEQATLTVKIEIEKDHILVIEIVNSCPKNKVDSSLKGIGLKNLRRRLELLYGQYELTTSPSERTFTATLKLPTDGY